jgi:CelD/BcsL family acetyltransferase involved in cellulose biosynthesis
LGRTILISQGRRVLRVEIKRNLSDFHQLEPAWDDLLGRGSAASPFLSHEWLACWLDCYLGHQPLILVLVYDDDRLVGIGPFYVQPRSHYGLITLRELRVLGTGEACPDHIDLPAEADSAPEVAAAIWQTLWGELGQEWDVIRCDAFDAHSRALAVFQKLAGDQPLCAASEVADITACPYVPLEGDFHSVMGKLGSKTRYNAGKSRRILEEKGTLVFEACRRDEDREAFMSTLIELHQRTWQARGLPGAFASPTFHRFHDLISQRFLAKGQLGLYVLRLDETPLAATYGFDYRGIHYGYLMGMKTAVNPKVSMGHLIMACMVEAVIGRGCREFDMLRGDEPYKYHWTHLERRDLTVVFIRSSVRSIVYLSLRGLRQVLRAVVKRITARSAEPPGHQ